jgi:uncharacterized protein
MTKMAEGADYWIKKLKLSSHPEGGYFRQTYRSDLLLPKSALPDEFSGPRAASTAIYFLLDEHNFSAFHRIRSDEMWHFYLGSSLVVHVIAPDGRYSEIRLGDDPEAGEAFQAVVKAGSWFASQLAMRAEAKLRPQCKAAGHNKTPQHSPATQFSLVGCTVAPGFDFADFELAKRDDLLRRHPQHQALISSLTRM